MRSTDRPSHPEHVPALDGIRGYGFLAVFLGHAFGGAIAHHRSNFFGNLLYNLQQIEWLAVPAFFVLSGYLIGGNLFRTRNREGFFRVFYYRRMLRVLPVYYVTLLVVAGVEMTQGVPLDYKFWSHFVYIQNFMPGYGSNSYAFESIRHLWSLAIEEQFYLTWPLVVWFAKDRATLLKVIGVLCSTCWTIRLMSPWIGLSSDESYVNTLTRVDTILFGVALALVTDHALYKRFQPFAKYAALAGAALWVISFSTHAEHPENYYRVAVEYTLANFTVVMVIVAVLEKGSAFTMACSARWVCWIGSMTYGLYIFHFICLLWLRDTLRQWLMEYFSPHLATVITVTTALVSTVLLAMVSYRFLEQPALSLKKYMKYGPERETKSALNRASLAAFSANPE